VAKKGGSSSRGGGRGSSGTAGTGGGGSQYQGSDINTGTQTPEGVTTPTTDVFDSGMAGGTGSMDNGNS
ncbi:MAG: hypothetical protein ACXVLT_10285, partial [Flavisolibacter sp.]